MSRLIYILPDRTIDLNILSKSEPLVYLQEEQLQHLGD